MATFSGERMTAARIIESLRAGVPTRASTRALPDLRPDFTRFIVEDLEALAEDRPVRGRLLWGQYGQGKSHALKRIEHLALDRGFAVSLISLSREISCHNLQNFYCRVANTLRTPSSNLMGIQTQLQQLKVADLKDTPLREDGRYCHALPSVIVELLIQARLAEDIHNLNTGLLGEALRLSDLRAIAKRTDQALLSRAIGGFRRGAHTPAFFGVLADTLRLCGLKGWVILVDEVELIARLGSISRLNACRNLNWLLNWSSSFRYPIYTVGAAASSLQERWYNATGRRRDDRSLLPELAEKRLGDEVRREMREFFETANSPHCLTIAPIERSSLRGLVDELVHLHSLAHDWTPGSAVDIWKATENLAPDEPVRTHIRAALEALDQSCLSGVTPSLEADELTQHGVEEDKSFFSEEESAEERN